MRQKVVVIGHGFTSRLGIIRSLGMAGYDVTVIVVVVDMRRGKPDMTPPVDSYSKYVKQVHYCLPDGELLIKLLLDKCLDRNQKTVIVPDSDFSAAVIDRNQKRLEADFLFPHIHHTPGAVVEWMDKACQKDAAAQAGLNVASGRLIHVANWENYFLNNALGNEIEEVGLIFVFIKGAQQGFAIRTSIMTSSYIICA